MDTQYAFVCGCPRSGTSAFANLLNAHPRIVMGVERFKFVPKEITPEHFAVDHFLSMDPSETDYPWKEGLAAARQKLHNGDVAVIGDKYPGYTYHLSRLSQVFPEPRFVFLLRNPLDVAESFERRATNPKDNWPQINNGRRAPELWNNALEKVSSLQQSSPDAKVFVVGYTSFFEGDRDTLSALCNFLGVAPSKLFEQGYQRYVQESHEIGKKRSQILSESDRAEILAECDDELARNVIEEHRQRNAQHYKGRGWLSRRRGALVP